ncbi:hypothetical protein ACHWQZ_G019562 [Mnemiopsis leidyi]
MLIQLGGLIELVNPSTRRPDRTRQPSSKRQGSNETQHRSRYHSEGKKDSPQNKDFLEIRSLLTNFQTNFQKEIIDLKSNLVSQESRLATKLTALNEKVWPPANAASDTTPQDDLADWLVTNSQEETSAGEGDPTLPTSVCQVVSDCFEDLKIEDVTEQIPFSDTNSSSRGRKLAYFGNKGYSYGTHRHLPRPYPECDVMSKVVSGLSVIDSGFNTADFSCLVTLYPDGRTTIPAHSDDESQIKGGSKIWTVSFGATRVLEFVRKTGSLVEHRVAVKHGSVYCMSADSQSHWSHELIYDPTIATPRVSLTFRHIVDPPPRQPAPPIENAPPKQQHTSKQKILFITDSVLNSTPEFLFNKVNNHRCIKTRNFYMTDIPKYESEFKHCSMVLLSMGINDMSCSREGRPHMSGSTLANWASKALTAYCSRSRNTTFILNSVLHTRHSWLNMEVDTFNSRMRHLASTIPNLNFVDSHAMLTQSNLAHRVDFVLDKHDPRGTHLTHEAKRLVAHGMTRACQHFALSGVPSSCNGLNFPFLKTGR